MPCVGLAAGPASGSRASTPRAPRSTSVSKLTEPAGRCLMRMADCRELMFENVLTGSTVNSTCTIRRNSLFTALIHKRRNTLMLHWSIIINKRKVKFLNCPREGCSRFLNVGNKTRALKVQNPSLLLKINVLFSKSSSCLPSYLV